MSEFTHIVAHYAEIGLKSNNRRYFEEMLISNMRRKLGSDAAGFRRESGQITVSLPDASGLTAALDALKRVPGIAYLSPAARVASDIPSLEREVVALLHGRAFHTFRIQTRRHDKSVPYLSMDANKTVGAAVLTAYPDRKVKLNEPELTVKIDVTGDDAYVSFELVPGVGGMPTNPRQKVVALLSGGLDSPVAAYMMMKRGCEVILVHFQNQNQMTVSVENKIVRLAEQLARYQIHTTLHIVPFEELQLEIIGHVESPLRMLIYRRVMIRLAAKLAAKHRAQFLVVGDSLSQVASQTYDNLSATYADAALPILTPLIGLDKLEITNVSRIIGTFEISALPYGDCCSYFIPKHPELRGRVAVLRAAESPIDLEKLGDAALASAKIVEWK